MSWPPFGVKRDGESIEARPVRQQVRTNISYDDPRMALGLIAEFEEREAAKESGCSWQEWEILDVRERAASVAHYRLRYIIQANVNDAVNREVERRSKSKRRSA